jgi:uncharacterized LabA/DUF88 family protein
MKKVAYIDAANIILSANRLGFEIDFLKLKVFLEDKFRVEEIYYFTAELKSLAEEIEVLKLNNFKVILKQIYYENSKTKANCDVEISHYITKHIENKEISKLVLLSGDGDFSMLLDYANQNKVEVVLMPVDKKSSAKLLRVKKYLQVTFLDQLKDRFIKEKTPAST